MKQRIAAMLLAFCLIFSLMPVGVSASQTGTWGNLTWTLDNGTLTFSGWGSVDAPVRQWNSGAYHTDAPWHGQEVTDLVIGEGITSIGNYAFWDMPGLKAVSLPSSLVEVCHGAFEDCTALERVDFPEGFREIGENAFRGCTGLVRIDLPDSLVELGSNAFYLCESLTGPIVIPEGITKIESDVFGSCKSLESVVLHDGITEISGFRGSGLLTVELPASVEYLGGFAFAECPNLIFIHVDEENEYYASDDQGVLYDKGMTTLCQVPGAFAGDLYIPETVKRLSNNVPFMGCTGVENLYLPAAMTAVQSYIFDGLTNLEGIWVDDANETLYDTDGVLYGKKYDYMTDAEYLSLIRYPAAKADVADFRVPEEVTKLDTDCFVNCRYLENVSIGANAATVELGIFANCASLQGIWFDEDHGSYLSDEFGAVYNKELYRKVYDYNYGMYVEKLIPAMTELTFFPGGRTGYYEVRGGVTNIQDEVFCGSRIEALKFPKTLTSLGYNCMSSCSDLHWILFTGDKPTFDPYSFGNVTATVYYPQINTTWVVLDDQGNVLGQTGGNLTYVPYGPTERPVYPGHALDNPFTDVPENSFYIDPVLWAVNNEITNGLSATEFGPTATCNRAQVVAFLWRAAGCPDPETTTHSFEDVAAGSFYEKPVLWALENGITNGADATHFNPTGVCNRAQVVTFLYRAFGSPAVDDAVNPFSDVPNSGWFTAPVLWAVKNGVTNGLSATEFGPTVSCNRAQVVTFMYRAYVK